MKTTYFRERASRRAFLGNLAATSTVVGAGIVVPRARAETENDGLDDKGRPNPIPSGGAPLAPFGIFIHHHALNPAIPLASIGDPSQITDLNGYVGLTNIHGGGIGTNTVTGAITQLAYRADMGFSQGKFIGTDGRHHHGTFAFV